MIFNVKHNWKILFFDFAEFVQYKIKLPDDEWEKRNKQCFQDGKQKVSNHYKGEKRLLRRIRQQHVYEQGEYAL